MMILEIRHYTLKPGRREAFVEFFEKHNRAALRDAGMLVFGPLRDLENPDKVHWMRAFSSLEERDRIKDSFYGEAVWNDQIEPIAMPMIAHYEAELVETTSGFESFDCSKSL
ncbi:NIPSNAP protein [Ruegeria faecimaris]|uniref:NIPSNAP protein n=3 Tax=Ruegeria faecimaris TaxID=686389 RepID=A0A521EDB7_9RHOB|nr:NIPSNAP protein [Ruegeria faecimaris]